MGLKVSSNIVRSISAVTLMCFTLSSVIVAPVYAQSAVVVLPAPAQMISLSSAYKPCILRGIKLDPQNPFRFDFVVDQGDSSLKDEAFEKESQRLVKYFLASLTTPEKDLWVNLSPYENGRIVNDDFGRTTMGRDLLAVDYVLKQITSSLMYPDSTLGKKFWGEVYRRAYEKFGTTDIPVDTFNKVWIVPEKAVVYENASGPGKNLSAYIDHAKLKVMLETDYIATSHASTSNEPMPSRGHLTLSEDSIEQGKVSPSTLPTSQPMNTKAPQGDPVTPNLQGDIAKAVIREVIIPVLEQEVNEGKNFAELRQIYHSLLLAVWFKQKLRSAVVAPTPDGKVQGNVLSLIFMDRKKTGGIETLDPKGEINGIYDRYVEAFKKGVYNLIREDVDTYSQETIPRKYFSGGMSYAQVVKTMDVKQGVPGSVDAGAKVVGVDIKPANLSEGVAEGPGISRRMALKTGFWGLVAMAFGESEVFAGAERDFIEGYHLQQIKTEEEFRALIQKKAIVPLNIKAVNAEGPFVFWINTEQTKGYVHSFMKAFLLEVQRLGESQGKGRWVLGINSTVRSLEKQKGKYASKSGRSTHTSMVARGMNAGIAAFDFIGDSRTEFQGFLERNKALLQKAGFRITYIWDEPGNVLHVSFACTDPRLIKGDPAQDIFDAAMSSEIKSFFKWLAVSIVALSPFYYRIWQGEGVLEASVHYKNDIVAGARWTAAVAKAIFPPVADIQVEMNQAATETPATAAPVPEKLLPMGPGLDLDAQPEIKSVPAGAQAPDEKFADLQAPPLSIVVQPPLQPVAGPSTQTGVQPLPQGPIVVVKKVVLPPPVQAPLQMSKDVPGYTKQEYDRIAADIRGSTQNVLGNYYRAWKMPVPSVDKVFNPEGIMRISADNFFRIIISGYAQFPQIKDKGWRQTQLATFLVATICQEASLQAGRVEWVLLPDKNGKMVLTPKAQGPFQFDKKAYWDELIPKKYRNDPRWSWEMGRFDSEINTWMGIFRLVRYLETTEQFDIIKGIAVSKFGKKFWPSDDYARLALAYLQHNRGNNAKKYTFGVKAVNIFQLFNRSRFMADEEVYIHAAKFLLYAIGPGYRISNIADKVEGLVPHQVAKTDVWKTLRLDGVKDRSVYVKKQIEIRYTGQGVFAFRKGGRLVTLSREDIFKRVLRANNLRNERELGNPKLKEIIFPTPAKIRDMAMVTDYAEAPDEVGGVDLNPDRLDMQFTGDGGVDGVQYQFTPEQVKMLDEGVPGFVPVIVSVTPAGNVAEFLGLK